jgi:hypothetical protein
MGSEQIAHSLGCCVQLQRAHAPLPVLPDWLPGDNKQLLHVYKAGDASQHHSITARRVHPLLHGDLQPALADAGCHPGVAVKHVAQLLAGWAYLSWAAGR